MKGETSGRIGLNNLERNIDLGSVLAAQSFSKSAVAVLAIGLIAVAMAQLPAIRTHRMGRSNTDFLTYQLPRNGRILHRSDTGDNRRNSGNRKQTNIKRPKRQRGCRSAQSS